MKLLRTELSYFNPLSNKQLQESLHGQLRSVACPGKPSLRLIAVIYTYGEVQRKTALSNRIILFTFQLVK